MVSSAETLGTAPTVQQVDEWMRALGLRRTVVGKSFQGRELVLYEDDASIQDRDGDETLPVVLFLSLVHGNEPMGLIALIQTAQMIHSSHLRRPSTKARILYFPIVNVDAYSLNLQHGSGCRRTNLRPTECSDEDSLQIAPCPIIPLGGVDLNRNFALDWNGTYSAGSETRCTFEYRGHEPFSEPETQAVRHVVLKYNVTVAMSFHSRSRSSAKPLLIHPFTSSRPISSMPVRDLKRFRQWSRAMNPSHLYAAGTAQEAIFYTASGSTIDWMYSVNVTPFVLEVSPPCNNRWCSHQAFAVQREAKGHAFTALRLVELAVHVDSDSLSLLQILYIIVLCLLGGMSLKRHRHKLLAFMRRQLRQKKQCALDQVSESELRILVATETHI